MGDEASEFGMACPEDAPDVICRETGAPCVFVDDTRSGHTVCRTCGDVFGGVTRRYIDPSAEWRHFADTPDTKDRLAGSQDKYISSTATCIAQGRGPAAGAHNQLRATAHSQKFSKQDKHLLDVWKQLKQYATQLQLSEKTVSACQDVYYEFNNGRGENTRGCRLDALICAALFIGCKRDGNSRAIREISRATGVNEHDIKKGHRLITKFVHDVPGQSSSSSQSSERIGRMCYQLRLPHPVLAVAEEAARLATEALEGRTPAAVASGALLFVLTKCVENGITAVERSDKDIAEVSGITAQTVRTAFSDLRRAKDDLVTAAMSRSQITFEIISKSVADAAQNPAPAASGAGSPALPMK